MLDRTSLIVNLIRKVALLSVYYKGLHGTPQTMSFAEVLTRPDPDAAFPVSPSFVRQRGRRPCSGVPRGARPTPDRRRTRASSVSRPPDRRCREPQRPTKRGLPAHGRDARPPAARAARRHGPRSG